MEFKGANIMSKTEIKNKWLKCKGVTICGGGFTPAIFRKYENEIISYSPEFGEYENARYTKNKEAFIDHLVNMSNEGLILEFYN